MNQLVALGTGLAGRLGFIGLLDDRFVNNYFAFGHSGYFLKDSRPDDHFMQSRWVKLLSDGVMPDRVDQRVTGGLLRGILTSLLINSEPIKLAIYSLPLVAITAASIYLYVGAVARQLAAEAVSLSSQAPDLAFLLAIESSRLRDDVNATSALVQVLQYNPALEKFTWGPVKDSCLRSLWSHFSGRRSSGVHLPL